MLFSGTTPTVHLAAGLALLVQPLREFLSVRLSQRHGNDWWRRCVEIQSEPVRERYDTEAKVRANSDPSFWLKVAEACWGDCAGDRLGAAERAATSNLRHYRNLLCHDSDRLSPPDVHHALLAVRLLIQAIAPPQVPAVDELILGFRIQHPTGTL